MMLHEKKLDFLRKIRLSETSVAPSNVNFQISKKRSFWTELFASYSENTSVHGIRYIGQHELHWSKR